MCHLGCNHSAFSWLSFNYFVLAKVIHHLYKEQGEEKTSTFTPQNWPYFRVDLAAASASGPEGGTERAGRQQANHCGTRLLPVVLVCVYGPKALSWSTQDPGAFLGWGWGHVVLRALLSEEEQAMSVEGSIKTKFKKSSFRSSKK